MNDRGSIYIEPKMSPQSVPLRLRSRSSTRFHGEVQVPVDATGRPDVLGIRVIGTMDSLMKQDLQEWLSTTSFVPAKRDGVPVAGVFKMKFN